MNINELKKQKRFIVYAEGKVPISPKTGQKMKVTNDYHLVTFAEAKKLVDGKSIKGIGIVLGNGLVGVDIDVKNVSTNEKERIDEMIKKCDSYTEISPSGNGYHILMQSKEIDKIGFRANEFEIYNWGRYFTFTENQVSKTDVIKTKSKKEIDDLINYILPDDRKNEIDKLAIPYAKRSKVANLSISPNAYQKNTIHKNSPLIQMLKKNQKFKDVFEGRYEKHFNNRSEADFYFMGQIVKVTDDAQKALELTLSSDMFREKWQTNRLYLDRTLAKLYQIKASNNGGKAYKNKMK